ncbi:MAG: EAL domain-containing protein [Alkalispirochaeta sp.]
MFEGSDSQERADNGSGGLSTDGLRAHPTEIHRRSVGNVVSRLVLAAAIPLLLVQFVVLATVGVQLVRTSEQRVREITDAAHDMLEVTLDESVRTYLRAIAETSAKIIRSAPASVPASSAIQRLLDSVEIAGDGYLYIIDYDGNVVMHPDESLVGTNMVREQPVAAQLQRRNGYHEYFWRNRKETAPGITSGTQRKALYMVDIPEQSWIVAATIYQDSVVDLVDTNQIGRMVASFGFHSIGYAVVIDRQGTLVGHPTRTGSNLAAGLATEESDELLDQLFSKGREQGRLTYRSVDEESNWVRTKFLYFRYVPSFDWAVAMIVDRSTLRRPFYLTGLFLVLVSGGLVVFISQLGRSLSRTISMPLMHLAAASRQEGALGPREIPDGAPREIATLVNRYRQYVVRIEDQKEQLRQLADFAEIHPHPILRIDGTGSITYANKEARKIFPDWTDGADPAIPDALLSFARDWIYSSRTEIVVSGTTFRVVRLPVGKSNDNYLTFEDATAWRKYQSIALLSTAVFENTIEGIVVTDRNGNITRVNSAFTTITGYTEDDAVGGHTRILKSGRHDTDFYRTMWRALESIGTWTGEIWNRRKNGEAYPQSLTITAITDGETGERQYAGVFHDLSERKSQDERLNHLAFFDALTKLPNRTLFTQRLEDAITLARADGRIFAMAVLDIIGFRKINNQFGFKGGDYTLEKFSRRLKNGLSGNASSARLGADTFALLLQEVGSDGDIVRIVDAVTEACTAPIEIDGAHVELAVATGIVRYPEDGQTAEFLLRNAEIAMERNRKQDGKSRYAFFNQMVDRWAVRRTRLERQLRDAVQQEDLYLMYQPQYNLKTGALVGLEALSRWRCDDGEEIPPDVFIPIAEDSNLIVKLGKLVLKRAAREAAPFIDRLGVHLAVNIAPRHFYGGAIVEHVLEAAEEAGIDPGSIHLEITERTAMADAEKTLEIIRKLRNHNIKIALDDFGTGYSSMAYLQRFHPDFVKVDKTFVSVLDEEDTSDAVVQAMVSLAFQLNARVIAEGIERAEQVTHLQSIGCEIGQGFHLGRPMVLAELREITDKIGVL